MCVFWSVQVVVDNEVTGKLLLEHGKLQRYGLRIHLREDGTVTFSESNGSRDPRKQCSDLRKQAPPKLRYVGFEDLFSFGVRRFTGAETSESKREISENNAEISESKGRPMKVSYGATSESVQRSPKTDERSPKERTNARKSRREQHP